MSRYRLTNSHLAGNHLARLDVEVGHQQLASRGLRDVVVVSQVASTGVDSTARPPALGAVGVGAQ